MKPMRCVAALVALILVIGIGPATAQKYDKTGIHPIDPGPPAKVDWLMDSRVELIGNGSFETGAFPPWQVLDISDFGRWFVLDSLTGPISGNALQPPSHGDWQAVVDQNGYGSHFLYQDVAVPPGTTVTLNLVYWWSNYAEAWADPGHLDASGVDPNQQMRIDIMDPAAPIDDVGAGVWLNLLHTADPDPFYINPTPLNADLTAFAGMTIRLRIAVVDNLSFFNVGIDAVSIDAEATTCMPFYDQDEFHIFMEQHGTKFLKGVETFEESNVPDGEVVGIPAPLDQNPNVDPDNGWGFPDGLEQQNIVIWDNISPEPNPPDLNPSGDPIAIAAFGENFFGANSKKIAINIFDIPSMDLVFTEPNHTGIGFNLSYLQGFVGDGWHISVFDLNNNEIGKFDVPSPGNMEPSKSFFGVWCEQEIGRINIFDVSLTGDAIDNIEMWQEVTELPPGLYACDSQGQLYFVDHITGLASPTCILPLPATEIEYNNINNRAILQEVDGGFQHQEFDIGTCAPLGPPLFNGAAFNGLEYVGNTLYGTAQYGCTLSELHIIDPNTGGTTLIGPTGVGPISGLVWDGTSDFLYGVVGCTSTYPSDLVAVDLATGVATIIGPTNVPQGLGGLAFGPNGVLYGIGNNQEGGNFYSINPATGNATLVGPTGFPGFSGLTLVGEPVPPQTGELLACTSIGQVYTIDATTGLATYRCDLPTYLNEGATEIEWNDETVRCIYQWSDGFYTHQEVNSLNCNPIAAPQFNGAAFNGLEYVDNVLYGTGQYGCTISELHIINPVDGSTVLIGPTGKGPISGLVWDGVSNFLYGVTGCVSSFPPELVKVDLATGIATTIGPTGVPLGGLAFGSNGVLYAGGANQEGGNFYRVNPANGNLTLIGNMGLADPGISGLTLVRRASAVDELTLNLGGELRLLPNVPNPFNPRTTLRFIMPTGGAAELSIFDVSGRKLVTLVDGTLEAGLHEFVWDGRNASGHPVNSGVYLSILESQNQTTTRKLILLK